MDALSLILRHVRLAIEAAGVPPDPLQDALDAAERACRTSLGGSFHPISRAPSASTKARIIELACQQLDNATIAHRLGVSDRYVRRIVSQLRIEQ
ncbi:helix-turn-helix domain-containing protein [Paucibacter sp. DJ4R-1]|nr:helix-turn-helix domain-containing protein [Paucibacter sp. DJ4R-1]